MGTTGSGRMVEILAILGSFGRSGGAALAGIRVHSQYPLDSVGLGPEFIKNPLVRFAETMVRQAGHQFTE